MGKMIHWNLQSFCLTQLKDNPKNPRQINKDQAHHLEKLIDTFGLIDKPIINLDKTIIGGHQRIKILKKKKIKIVECWVPNRQLEQAEIDYLCIGLNLNQGKWDYDILANEWDALDLLNWGFTEDQLLGDCTDAEGQIEDEEKKLKEEKNKKECCPSCGFEF